MKVSTITINLMWLPAFCFTMWLGFTGRVDWWIIAMVYAITFEVNATFEI